MAIPHEQKPLPSCRFIPKHGGTSNPGGRGHVWVKSLFINKRPAPGMERPEEYDPNDYSFIRASLEDNPIYAMDASYLKTLDSLPPQLYRAFRQGDWDIFAGQYFSIFDHATHTAKPHELGLQPWWPRWISGDWGYEHPAAVYWHAKDGDRIITYRELYGSHIDEPELGRRIAELSNADKDSTGRPIKIQHVYFDQYAFAKRTSQNTIAEQIGDVLAENGIPRPELADDDRIGGARLCYELLKAELAIISTACPHLIECLSTLIHDEDNLEDVLKVDKAEGAIGDDPYDAWRYGLKSMLDSRNAPLAVRVHNRLEEYAKTHNTTIGKMSPQELAMRSWQAQRAERPKQQARRFRPGMRFHR